MGIIFLLLVVLKLAWMLPGFVLFLILSVILGRNVLILLSSAFSLGLFSPTVFFSLSYSIWVVWSWVIRLESDGSLTLQGGRSQHFARTLLLCYKFFNLVQHRHLHIYIAELLVILSYIFQVEPALRSWYPQCCFRDLYCWILFQSSRVQWLPHVTVADCG